MPLPNLTAPRIGSLCTGYGGLDHAITELTGGHVTWVCDPAPEASALLTHHWPHTPNHGDLTTTDWAQAEPVEIICGGYPCQPFSYAGKRKGTDDERHLWPHIARILRIHRPRYAFFENVAGHRTLGLDVVLADLAALGFDAEWTIVRASDVGAPHHRRRLFLAARLQDAHVERGGDRLAAPEASQGRRARPEPARRAGTPAADAAHLGPTGAVPARDGRDGPAYDGEDAADTEGDGRREGWPEPAWFEWGPDASLGGHGHAPDWGVYAAAIERWEHVTGRTAPPPTGLRGRLSPLFVEWMMGLPFGHITSVPGLTKGEKLTLLGNGVVPQQAAYALRILTGRLEETFPQAV